LVSVLILVLVLVSVWFWFRFSFGFGFGFGIGYSLLFSSFCNRMSCLGKRILAILYLLRSDPVDFVQNMASTTWKNVVENTPKTLKSIFPNLLTVIFDSLSSNTEKRVLGRDTLKDIVWKLGDGVIYEIVSKLEKNFSSANPIVRYVGIASSSFFRLFLRK
jgi:hypothetical protein